jgi:hypothetical protein
MERGPQQGKGQNSSLQREGKKQGDVVAKGKAHDEEDEVWSKSLA